jgi:hypothetical protein
MKRLNKLIPFLVYALVFTISIAIAQNKIPTIQGKSYKFEYGHFESNRQTMVCDTTIDCNIDIKIYEDAVLVDSKLRQDYTLGLTLDKENDDNHYLLSIEAIDQDRDLCNVIIYYNKITKIYILTIAYNNIFIKYYI